jgi:hypothetical protein
MNDENWFWTAFWFVFGKCGVWVSLVVSLATIVLPFVLAFCYDICWWKSLIAFLLCGLASAVSWVLTIGMNH